MLLAHREHLLREVKRPSKTSSEVEENCKLMNHSHSKLMACEWDGSFLYNDCWYCNFKYYEYFCTTALLLEINVVTSTRKRPLDNLMSSETTSLRAGKIKIVIHNGLHCSCLITEKAIQASPGKLLKAVIAWHTATNSIQSYEQWLHTNPPVPKQIVLHPWLCFHHPH